MTPDQMRMHHPIASMPAIGNDTGMRPEKYIGLSGYLRITNPDPRRDSGELLVEVAIVGAKAAFGRIDVEVTPVAGSGTQWVALTSLECVR